MSSKDFQVVKRMRKVQLKPQGSGGEVLKSSKVKTIGSTRTGERFGISQTSATVSGRELNRDALTSVKDRIQLPGRDSASGMNQSSISRTVQRFGVSGSGSSLTAQGGSRFGAGASGNGNGLTAQGGSRFGAGASGSGLTAQVGSRFGAGASGSSLTAQGGSRFGAGASGSSLTAQGGSRFGAGASGNGLTAQGGSRF